MSTPEERVALGTAAAWGDYEARNDPPGSTIGLTVKGRGATETGTWTVDFGGLEVHVAPAWRGNNGVPGFGLTAGDGHRSTARVAAWGWYKRRLALAEKLYHGVWCPECGSDEAHVEAIDEKTTTQPWCVECDVEMGGVCEGIWPRCLTWTDEQVSEVEAWTADTSQPQPAVLQEDDEP